MVFHQHTPPQANYQGPRFRSGYFGVRFLEEKLSTYDFEIEGERDPENIALAISAAIAAYYGL